MIIFIAILISSIAICIQDFCYRLINLYWIAVFGIGTLIYSFVNEPHFYFFLIINCIFFVITFLLLWLYFAIKEKQKTALINRYIGLGDIIILLILATSYNLYNLAVLILASCISGLLYYALVYKKKGTTIRIPLAGILVVLHCIFQLYSQHIKTDTFYYTIL